jgi:hypothetical protein
MRKFTLSVVIALISNQAFAFVGPNQKYKCNDGRHFATHSSQGNGVFSMDFYTGAGTSDYYEGSIAITSPSAADVFHSEGDKTGTIRVGGLNRVCIEVDNLNTCCFLQK